MNKELALLHPVRAFETFPFPHLLLSPPKSSVLASHFLLLNYMMMTHLPHNTIFRSSDRGEDLVNSQQIPNQFVSLGTTIPLLLDKDLFVSLHLI